MESSVKLESTSCHTKQRKGREKQLLCKICKRLFTILKQKIKYYFPSP